MTTFKFDGIKLPMEDLKKIMSNLEFLSTVDIGTIKREERSIRVYSTLRDRYVTSLNDVAYEIEDRGNVGNRGIVGTLGEISYTQKQVDDMIKAEASRKDSEMARSLRETRLFQ